MNYCYGNYNRSNLDYFLKCSKKNHFKDIRLDKVAIKIFLQTNQTYGRPKEFLSELTKHLEKDPMEAAKNIWIVDNNSYTESLIKQLNLNLMSNVYLLKKNESQIQVLEAYKVHHSHPVTIAPFIIWTEGKGFFNHQSLLKWERRSNLEGHFYVPDYMRFLIFFF